MRDGDGFHLAVGMVGNADDGEESGGNEERRGVALGRRVFGADLAEAEKVGEDAGAFFLHEQMNFDEVLEAKRFLVIARGVDSREAERRIEVIQRDGESEGTIETVLGGFHEAKEIGVMNNAGEIGIGKFYAADRFKLVWHRGRVRGRSGSVKPEPGF